MLGTDTLEKVPPAFHLSIWAKLTLYLGFSPDIQKEQSGSYFCLQDGLFLDHPSLLHPYLDEQTTAHLLSAIKWDFSSPLQIPKQGRSDLLEGLLRFMNIHLDGFGSFKSGVLGRFLAKAPKRSKRNENWPKTFEIGQKRAKISPNGILTELNR